MRDGAGSWIARLGLQVGPDGVYSAQHHVAAAAGERRALLRVRYLLLTSRAPRTATITGPADALYFHHAGGSLRVHTRGPAGPRRGDPLGPPDAYQVAVAGGSARALELVDGAWALISAAELPGDPAPAHISVPELGDRSADGRSPTEMSGHEPGDRSMSAGRPPAETPVPELGDRSADAGRSPAEMSAHEPGDRSMVAGPGRGASGAALRASLGLRPHPEGGHFTERWRAAAAIETARGPRSLGSTIYYLLSAGASVGHFHRNTSAITHLFHSGGPIVYQLLSPAGEWHEVVLGADAGAGQVPSFTCPGEFFKSSHLGVGVEHGLISEIVAPGFDYADHTMADATLFMRLFPQHRARWAAYVR